MLFPHYAVSPLLAVVPALATLGTGRNLLIFVLNEGNETLRQLGNETPSGEDRQLGNETLSGGERVLGA